MGHRASSQGIVLAPRVGGWICASFTNTGWWCNRLHVFVGGHGREGDIGAFVAMPIDGIVMYLPDFLLAMHCRL